MSKTQRYIINAAIAVVISMALFPPWYMEVGGGRVIYLGYAPIFLPPTYSQSELSGTINMKTLFVQWVAVFIVAVWGYFAAKRKGNNVVHAFDGNLNAGGFKMSVMEQAKELVKHAKTDMLDAPSTLGREYMILRGKMLLGKSVRAEELAKRFHDTFLKLRGNEEEKKAMRKAVLEYIENRDASPSIISDPDLRSMAVQFKDLMSEIGKQLVDAGILKQEQFDAHDRQYIHKEYLKFVLEEEYGKDNALDIIDYVSTGKGKKLNLGYTKERKLKNEMKELKMVYGEIDDLSYLMYKTIVTPVTDLAINDFLSEIAQNPEWALPNQMVEWSELENPDYRVPGTSNTFTKNEDGTINLTVNKTKYTWPKRSNVKADEIGTVIGVESFAKAIRGGKGKPFVGFNELGWKRIGNLVYKKNKDGTYNLSVRKTSKTSETLENLPVEQEVLSKHLGEKAAERVVDGKYRAVGSKQMTPWALRKRAEQLRFMANAAPDNPNNKAWLELAQRADKLAGEALTKMGLGSDSADILRNMPEGYRQMPLNRRYGSLAGLIVKKGVYDDIVGNLAASRTT